MITVALDCGPVSPRYCVALSTIWFEYCPTIGTCDTKFFAAVVRDGKNGRATDFTVSQIPDSEKSSAAANSTLWKLRAAVGS